MDGNVSNLALGTSSLLDPKTYAPDSLATTPWWLTNDWGRKAYNLLATQARKGTLFHSLKPALLETVTGSVSSPQIELKAASMRPYAKCSYNTVHVASTS